MFKGSFLLVLTFLISLFAFGIAILALYLINQPKAVTYVEVPVSPTLTPVVTEATATPSAKPSVSIRRVVPSVSPSVSQ